MPFKKGKSGNPKGRPKTKPEDRAFREGLENLAPEAIEQLGVLVREGNLKAIQLVLDKTVPSYKPIDIDPGQTDTGDNYGVLVVSPPYQSLEEAKEMLAIQRGKHHV